jgi:hypothetical protein
MSEGVKGWSGIHAPIISYVVNIGRFFTLRDRTTSDIVRMCPTTIKHFPYSFFLNEIIQLSRFTCTTGLITPPRAGFEVCG